jgi:alkylation response protein AidB-like acyl-CoA dehydrogenase
MAATQSLAQKLTIVETGSRAGISEADIQSVLAQAAEGAAERDRDRIAPHPVIAEVRKRRIGAFRLPIASGGAGASLPELFQFAIRLGSADSNVAHILRNHFAFVEQCLRWTHPSHQARWFPRLADGKLFGLASTELGRAKAGGRDLGTTLKQVAGEYRLSGTKYYSTGNLYADYLVVSAARHDAPVTLIIPVDRQGIIIEDDWDGIGQRLTASGTTRFIDVRVNEDEILPGDIQSAVHHQATFPQLYLTAVVAGIMKSVLQDAVKMTRARTRTFYHAPSDKAVDDPILQQLIGQIASNAFAAEATVLAAAKALSRSFGSVVNGVADSELAHEASLRAAEAKVVVDDLAVRTSNLIFEAGSASTAKASAMLDRHWRNIRTLAAHNPIAYKARSIGQYELSGQPLPAGAFF